MTRREIAWLEAGGRRPTRDLQVKGDREIGGMDGRSKRGARELYLPHEGGKEVGWPRLARRHAMGRSFHGMQCDSHPIGAEACETLL